MTDFEAYREDLEKLRLENFRRQLRLEEVYKDRPDHIHMFFDFDKIKEGLTQYRLKLLLNNPPSVLKVTGLD